MATKKTSTKSKAASKAKTPAASSRATTQKKSRILAAVHESVQDLHGIGLIEKTTMREFDALCLPDVPNYTPQQIKAIRTRCNASQAVFAKYINVTTSSLQKWEIGTKKPSSAALKLLHIVDTKGLEVLL